MPIESEARLRVEMITASDWLREFLIEHVGEDVAFDALLGRRPGNHPNHAETIAELDRLRLLKATMDNLQILLGGERVAANWLFDSARFRRTVGFVPFDYLEDGEFDALALMHAFTEVQADHRRVADMPDCAPVKGTGQAADIDLARFFDNED